MPPLDEPVISDFSFHLGINSTEMRRMQRAIYARYNCGPNNPSNDEDECTCVSIFDLMDFERDLEDEKCHDKYSECNRKYWFKDSSNRLNTMFGEELGGSLMRKIEEECQPILHGVFFEEGKMCKDSEAEEVYDCVNKAIDAEVGS